MPTMEEAINLFDFEAVHAYMRDRVTRTGRPKPWTWQDEDEAPSAVRLTATARGLLEDAREDFEAGLSSGRAETGGFTAIWRGDEEVELLFDRKAWPRAKEGTQ